MAGVLQDAHVLVVGMGGVGGYAADAIARSGVGEITPVAGVHRTLFGTLFLLAAQAGTKADNAKTRIITTTIRREAGRRGCNTVWRRGLVIVPVITIKREAGRRDCKTVWGRKGVVNVPVITSKKEAWDGEAAILCGVEEL